LTLTAPAGAVTAVLWAIQPGVVPMVLPKVVVPTVEPDVFLQRRRP
jgi:hypothetical protein